MKVDLVSFVGHLSCTRRDIVGGAYADCISRLSKSREEIEHGAAWYDIPCVSGITGTRQRSVPVMRAPRVREISIQPVGSEPQLDDNPARSDERSARQQRGATTVDAKGRRERHVACPTKRKEHQAGATSASRVILGRSTTRTCRTSRPPLLGSSAGFQNYRFVHPLI